MSKFRRMLVENKGFTLIELLVVVAVLGILAAIAIPRLTGVTEEARDSSLRASGSSLRSAIEMNIADTGHFPGAADSSDDGTVNGDDTTLNFDSQYYIGINLDEYKLDINNSSTSGYIVELQALDNDGNATGSIVEITPSGVAIQ